jgi:ankyrin repeat protein
VCQIAGERSREEISLPKRVPKRPGAKAEQEEMSLPVAAYLGSVKAVEVLLASGADINAVDGSGGTALHRAVKGQKEDMVRLLLENGAKPDGVLANWKTPLHYAAEKGGLEILTLLLDHKANINAGDEFGWTPLYYADANGNGAATKLLRQRGATDRRLKPRVTEQPD